MKHVVHTHDAKSRLSKLVAMAQRGDWPQVPLSAFAPMTDDELADAFGVEFADMLVAATDQE